ncbi:efflux RND transporter periplasmic adaptor subunit [Paraflavitalea sp. CAU 1676]|uniref:efflux RND transporter periplasmic adaptor subunit n=1 Tax=Paraflavitalea sp. CAU 1676 TaxID=3032598 RepID=UPI0023DACB30|nr:efflux RND transporter periplasmic adaptor subunit [Paraflavitalea sp. CAU 1676]MDF2191335.1 efflux RND transporter periplasmic adaptor subunit [Paraflavitalea sp. CAU 1676]
MRKNYIVKMLAAILLASVSLFSCKDKAGSQATHAGHKQAQQYTCPMHPQVIRDQPGTCPICGMELVLKDANKELVVDSSVALLTKPTNERVIASIPAIKAETGTRISSVEVSGRITYDTRNQTSLASRVSGRIEKLLVKYNFQPVMKGQLIMEIYSPDLAAAQRELIFVANNSPEMLAGAKQRLILLGLPANQVEQVIKTGKISYRVPVYSNANGYILEQSAIPTTPAAAGASTMGQPAAAASGMEGMGGGSPASNSNVLLPVTTPTPVMIREGQYVNAGQMIFTIYQATNLVAEFAFLPSLATELKKGQKLLFYPAGNKNAIQSARIGLIEPVFRNGQNFLIGRVYLNKNNFQVGQLLTGIIPVVYSGNWWLPKKSVWRLGTQSVVFRKDNGLYSPTEIQTGIESEGFIQVITEIAGWQVASNAAYLVDSESFIKVNGKAKQ